MAYIDHVLTVPQGGTGSATLASNGILYGAGASAIAVTSALASGVVITSAGSVPSISQTLPTAVQDNITRLGTIVSGSVPVSILSGILGTASGGTGQNTCTNGDLLIGVTSTGQWTINKITQASANQVVVANGNGTITLSTPQDIAVASSPTFAQINATTRFNVTSSTSQQIQIYYDVTPTAYVTFNCTSGGILNIFPSGASTTLNGALTVGTNITQTSGVFSLTGTTESLAQIYQTTAATAGYIRFQNQGAQVVYCGVAASSQVFEIYNGAVIFTVTNAAVTINGVQFRAGSGSPSGVVTAPQGSLFMRTDGSSAITRAYINTDAGTTWTALTTVA